MKFNALSILRLLQLVTTATVIVSGKKLSVKLSVLRTEERKAEASSQCEEVWKSTNRDYCEKYEGPCQNSNSPAACFEAMINEFKTEKEFVRACNKGFQVAEAGCENWMVAACELDDFQGDALDATFKKRQCLALVWNDMDVWADGIVECYKMDRLKIESTSRGD